MSKNKLEKQANTPLGKLRSYLAADSVKQRLEETLGKRAGAFANSIVNVMRGSKDLQKCSPDSVMSAAMVAATMNLPIDPALGQAAIVPYAGIAQFQIMYRGVIQLCIRSGQYKAIHCSEVYQDELKSYNPLTGDVKFHAPETFKMRDKGDKKNVVGHYAHFKLLRGFEKSDFMTHEQVMAHAKEYSKSYQSDIRYKKKTSAWSTDPIAMGNKTVLLRLLKKYGVMSMDMQDAFVADNTFEAAQARSDDEVDAKTGKKHVDVKMTDTEPAEPPTGDDEEFMEGADDPDTKAEAEKQKADLVAADVQGKLVCQSCGTTFDEKMEIKKGKKTWRGCPECNSKGVIANPNYVNEDAFDEPTEPE